MKPTICFKILRAARRVGELRLAIEARRGIIALAHEAGAGGTFVVSDRYAGFFSLYLQAVGAFAVASRCRRKLLLDYRSGPYFDPGRNESTWWRHYFETDEYSPQAADHIRGKDHHRFECASLEAQGRLAHFGTALSRSDASSIVSNFQVRPEISAQVDKFANRQFQGRFVVGIHYRGTDKVAGAYAEAARVDYRLIAEIVRCVLAVDKRVLVFVATDEAELLGLLLAFDDDGRVLYTDSMRSNTQEPLHLGLREGVAPYRLGREALIDAMLLARTDFLLRTSSNLSLASTLMNPTLESINISHVRSRRLGGRCSVAADDVRALILNELVNRMRLT